MIIITKENVNDIQKAINEYHSKNKELQRLEDLSSRIQTGQIYDIMNSVNRDLANKIQKAILPIIKDEIDRLKGPSALCNRCQS